MIQQINSENNVVLGILKQIKCLPIYTDFTIEDIWKIVKSGKLWYKSIEKKDGF